MRVELKTFFKDFDPQRRATCCLSFELETPDDQYRDWFEGKIKALLVEGPEEEVEQKEAVLGFHQEVEVEEIDEEDLSDGDELCKGKASKTPQTRKSTTPEKKL